MNFTYKFNFSNPFRSSLALLVLMLMGVQFTGFAQSNPKVLDKIVARVDNHYILKSEIEELRFNYESNNQKAPDECQLLESLIINKMLLAKAEIDSVKVDDAEVEGEMSNRMKFMMQRFGSEKNLVEAYGKSIDALKNELRQQMKDQLTIQTMQQNISGNVKITPSEVRKFFNSIPKDSLPFIPAQVVVGHIVRTAKVTQEQKDKLRNQLIDFRKRILAGEDFATLAQIYSDDVESAKVGGDLGFAGRGMMVPEFEGAALALQPNEISEPIESKFGFHLIQLLATRGAEYHSRHILLRPDYNKGTDVTEATRHLDSLRTLIVSDSLKFSIAAKDNSQDDISAESGGILTNPETGTNTMSLDASMDPALYFVLDTMQVGDISPPIQYRTDDGATAMRIVWYKEKKEAHIANLEDDYERIAQIVLANKKNNALEEWFLKAQGDVFISLDPEFQHCKVFGIAPTQSQ